MCRTDFYLFNSTLEMILENIDEINLIVIILCENTLRLRFKLCQSQEIWKWKNSGQSYFV